MLLDLESWANSNVYSSQNIYVSDPYACLLRKISGKDEWHTSLYSA